MTSRSSTSVSVKGDRQYIQQLKALAAKHNISLAELTRRALDLAYGDELKGASAFFAASSVASKQQMSNE